MRAYDPGRKRWVVWLNWTGGQPSRFSQMEGEFENGEISILAPGALAPGKQQAERYTFSKVTPVSCQWDAARTNDGGETWQTYWIMEFTRRGDATATDASNATIVHPPTQPYCQRAEHRQLDGFIGVWRGTIRRNVGANAREGTVVLRGTSMLEGCGIQLFTEITWEDGVVDRAFEAASFDPEAGKWMLCAIGGEGQRRLHTRETDFDAAARTWTISTAAPRQQPTREMWSFPTPNSLRREEQAPDRDWNWHSTGDTISVVREQ